MNYSVSIELDVDATNVRQGIVPVRSKLVFPSQENVALRIAEWLPAFHAPRGPLKFVAGLECFAGDKQVAWQRDPASPFRFIIEAGEPVDSLECSHDFLTPTESSQGRVVMTPKLLRVQWAGLCFYPEHWDKHEIGVTASVRYPEGWHAASALKVESKEGDTVRYGQTSLAELIDSPVLAGVHRHYYQMCEGVSLETFADFESELPQNQEQLETHANLVAEADALFLRRPFENYTFLLACSTRLGRIGLEHRSSSENGVRSTYFTEWQTSVTERDLLPHEFVHSWVGKYRVPFGNLTRKFEDRMTNELMWVYEGLTQYYGHVLAARSGLIPQDDTLGAFALIAATYDERPGRKWRSLEDTFHDPIISERSPRPWTSWSRSEDYYSEGALIWLEADMIIRRGTNFTKSLDDFAQAFFAPDNWADMASGYDRAEVFDTLNAVYPYDWKSFCEARVDQPTPNAPLAGLENGGFQLVWGEEPSGWLRCDQHHNSFLDLAFSLGLKVGLNAKIIEVIWNSPAFDAGLAIGGRINQVDGQDYSHERLVEAVSTASREKRPIELSVSHSGEERLTEIHWTEGHRYPSLEPLPGQRPLEDALQPRRPATKP